MRVEIVAVDPAQRLIQGRTKDRVGIPIALWEIPAAFRWPQVGEIWSIYYENNFPILGERIQGRVEPFLIESLNPGDGYLDAPTTPSGTNFLYDAAGNKILSTASLSIPSTNRIQVVWASVVTSGATATVIDGSGGVVSVSNVSTGIWQIDWLTPFANLGYSATAQVYGGYSQLTGSQNTGFVQITTEFPIGTLTDGLDFNITALGPI